MIVREKNPDYYEWSQHDFGKVILYWFYLYARLKVTERVFNSRNTYIYNLQNQLYIY